MNDFDLESKLKNLRVPERTEEYWNDFPSQVRGQLHRASPELPSHSAGGWQLAWAGGVALALVLVCFQFHPLQTVSLAIAKQERHFHMQLARLDTGLHKLMLNTDGMGYLLAEAN
jgi:hypothetical protein